MQPRSPALLAAAAVSASPGPGDGGVIAPSRGARRAVALASVPTLARRAPPRSSSSAWPGFGAGADRKVTVEELVATLNDVVPGLTRRSRGESKYPSSFARGQDFPIALAPAR